MRPRRTQPATCAKDEKRRDSQKGAGLFHPNLWNIKRMAAVSAYGESRRDVAAKRDPPQRFVRDSIGALIDPNGQFECIALYDMNFTKAPRRAPFLKRVTRVFEAWREPGEESA